MIRGAKPMTPEDEARKRRFLLMTHYCDMTRRYENFDATVRKVLAGAQRVQPFDLHVYLGGHPGAFNGALEDELCNVLRRHGYVEEMDLDDPGLGTVFVRHERWLEDTYWQDLVFYGREAMIARLMAEYMK